MEKSDLDELEALFEDDCDPFQEEVASVLPQSHDEPNNIESSVEELSSIKAKYEELQKQMAILEEQMNSKKVSSAPVTLEQKEVNSSAEDASKHESSSTQKRSFCTAFSSTFTNANSDDQANFNKDKSVEEMNFSKLKSTKDKSDQNKFYSSQKKPRISHSNNEAIQVPVPPAKSGSKVSKSSLLKKPEHHEIEYYSRIRIKSRYVDETELKQRMEGKLFIKLSLLRPTLSIAEGRDWVTIGVVAKQMDPQTAKNGKTFCIWHLTDLDDCTKHVAFFLFGKIHQELWKKITVGTVVGLLNPSIMPPKRDNCNTGKNYDNSPALTVDVAERVMKIGVAADLGWCLATKYRNKQPAGKCLAVVNKQFGDVCIYHMQSKYKKMSGKRGELQGAPGPRIPMKYKQTLWNKVKNDQFFYGGQTFNAAPRGASNNQPKKESKIKLTDVLQNCNSSSSNQNSEEMERSKIIQALSGIDEKQCLTGCTDKFAEMLSSGDMVAGSRQFLNHLQKKKISKEQKPNLTNLSAAEVLKQQKQMLNKRSCDDDVTGQTASSFLQCVRSMTSSENLGSTSKQKNSSEQRKVATSRPLTTSSKFNSSSNSRTSKSPTTLSARSQSEGILSKSDNCNESRGFKQHKDASASAKESTSSNAGNVPQNTSHLMQRKRDKHMNTTNSNPSRKPGISKLDVLPQLGCGAPGGNEVDLFGGWLTSGDPPTKQHNVPTLAELRKRRAIAKLRNESGKVKIKPADPNRPVIGVVGEVASNKTLRERVQLRVEANRNDLVENKENLQQKNVVAGLTSSKMSEEEFRRILKSSSAHVDELDTEEMERQENYFNPLIKKEMMELKMSETYEIPAKVVTCQQCNYTFWAPHDRCKAVGHALSWRDVKKKFFECTNCKQRTATWEPYPIRSCRNCGSEKLWKKSSMWKSKDPKLDSETLLIRGIEHSKFLDSMKSGAW